MQESSSRQKAPCKLWTRDLVLIILVNLCVFTNHIMSLSTFPFYIQSLGGTEALAGMCAAFFCLVAVVVRPFVGWWLDNGARRVVLVVGLILLALAPVGYGVFGLRRERRTLRGVGSPQRYELLQGAGGGSQVGCGRDYSGFERALSPCASDSAKMGDLIREG